MQRHLCTELFYIQRSFKPYTVTSSYIRTLVSQSHKSSLNGQSSLNGRLPPHSSSLRLLQPHQVCFTQNATFFKKEKELSLSDPVKGKLVYVGTISNMVRMVKLFSLSTSIMGIAFQPVLYTKAVASHLPFFAKIFMSGFMNFFIFATPMLLHFVTRRYITHMYYNPETQKFTATNLTFFVNDKDTVFEQKQVTVPEIPGVFTTIKVDGRPFFFDPAMFLDKSVFIKMMGYDQPMDWSFDEEILKGIDKHNPVEEEKKKVTE